MSSYEIAHLVNSIIIGSIIWWFTYRKWWPYDWKGNPKVEKKENDKQV